MGDGGSGPGAVVLEDEDVLESPIIGEVRIPIPVGADDFVDMLLIEGGNVAHVIGRLDDHLVSTYAAD